MDIASLAGFLLGVFMFLYGVFSAGGFSALQGMYDFPSIVITFGGSIAGTLACHKLGDFINGFKSFTLIFQDRVIDPAASIKNIIDLANVARRSVSIGRSSQWN